MSKPKNTYEWTDADGVKLSFVRWEGSVAIELNETGWPPQMFFVRDSAELDEIIATLTSIREKAYGAGEEGR